MPFSADLLRATVGCVGTVTRPERWQQEPLGADPEPQPPHRPAVSVDAWIMLAAVAAPIVVSVALIPWRARLNTADEALFLVVAIVAVASTGRRIAAATAALYGPLHGGANEAVLRMLVDIGSVDKVPAYIKGVKAGERKLMGFGHRVYKNYDPRARIVKHIAYEVFDVMGRNPMIDIALEVERIALEDDYFISRRLYPNVDFYTGLIYQSMGFPVTMFPVLFAIPRTAGWIAQWEEMLLDPEQKISRPRQVFLGAARRSYVGIDNRS